jgi:hypothetical protein
LSFILFYNLTESGLIATRSLEWILFVAVAGALSTPTMNTAWRVERQMQRAVVDVRGTR